MLAARLPSSGAAQRVPDASIRKVKELGTSNREPQEYIYIYIHIYTYTYNIGISYEYKDPGRHMPIIFLQYSGVPYVGTPFQSLEKLLGFTGG